MKIIGSNNEYERELNHVLNVVLPACFKRAELQRAMCGPTESEIFEHGLYKVEYAYEECDDGPQVLAIVKGDSLFSEAFMHDLHLKFQLNMLKEMQSQVEAKLQEESS